MTKCPFKIHDVIFLCGGALLYNIVHDAINFSMFLISSNIEIDIIFSGITFLFVRHILIDIIIILKCTLILIHKHENMRFH